MFDGCLLSCANDVYAALLPVLEINSGNQNVFKVDISKCIISAEYKHKLKECDGCLISLAFGVDTKVSLGDYLRESKCVQGVHIKQV